MKELYTLLIASLLTFNALGQDNIFGEPSRIFDWTVGMGTFREDFDYFFDANNSKYFLAYDTIQGYDSAENNKYNRKYSRITSKNMSAKRDLVLYRKISSNNWIKASNVVQTDYDKCDSFDASDLRFYDSEHSFIKIRAFGSGNVFVLENGCVIMFITNEYLKEHDVNIFETYKYNSIIVFIPNFLDGTYTATRFEPIEKKTKNAYLQTKDTNDVKITTVNNNIKIEIWSKIRCGENEKYDGFIINDSDTNGKKIKVYYKRDINTTLNFTINNNIVDYSGTYGLIKTN